jgi:hypothetical protein
MDRLCFVVMPFGSKRDENGRLIDFDRIFKELIEPAIREAGLEPLRADGELSGGFIHKAMFERLMLCDIALADLSVANANVYYELGIRHGIRPHSTVLIAASGTRLPFDLGPIRFQQYDLGPDGLLAQPKKDRAVIAQRLEACLDPQDDSPLFQLISEWPKPDIARLKTDRFRELVDYSIEIKAELARARAKATRQAVAKIEKSIDLPRSDPAILIDLMLSYRAVSAWSDMLRIIDLMPAVFRRAVMLQEQRGFALNRLGRREEAEDVLLEVIAKHGPSSETNGLLGRVYKDAWEETKKAGDRVAEHIYLRKSIKAYLEGFEADWRDAFPGVNALTLMELSDPVDHRQSELLPVVEYAMRRRLAAGAPDYWDHATRLELAVLVNDVREATEALGEALAARPVPEHWQRNSTAKNIDFIARARASRGGDVSWITRIVAQLRMGSGKNIEADPSSLESMG